MSGEGEDGGVDVHIPQRLSVSWKTALGLIVGFASIIAIAVTAWVTQAGKLVDLESGLDGERIERLASQQRLWDRVNGNSDQIQEQRELVGRIDERLNSIDSRTERILNILEGQ